jgi:hypothetical protein
MRVRPKTSTHAAEGAARGRPSNSHSPHARILLEFANSLVFIHFLATQNNQPIISR